MPNDTSQNEKGHQEPFKKTKKESLSKKEQALFENLLKSAEQFVEGRGFREMTEQQLIAKLSIVEQHIPLFQRVLAQMEERGVISRSEGGLYAKKENSELIVKGLMRMHARGFGFLQPENNLVHRQDVFIPKHLTKNAVDGDLVEVLVNTQSISEKGPEGRVVAILSRSRTHLAGIVRHVDADGYAIAYSPLLGTAQTILIQPSDERTLKEGDRVVMEVVDWGSKEKETICRFSHYLGHISDPSCDVKAAIEEFELRADFPMKAIEEAAALGKAVSQKDIVGREDLRHLETFTIDPDTAKDFDDALSLTRDGQGRFHLGVHIADVSHYVKPGSALDLEAQARCNSTYFPGVCIPMLPRELSENLCSLKEKVNRLTISVQVVLSATGELIEYTISRAVIKSAKRFTYRQAKEVIDGKKKSPHAPTLLLMVELCRVLKQKRYERGSIEFALPELVALVDDQGVPYGTDYVTYDITHQMVEEFMLKANEIVAWDLSQRGKNLTYRVHDEPAQENIRDFALLAGAFGFRLPDTPTSRDLQKMFEEAGESPYANYLASSFIRRMRLASYSPENIGHYGLSLTHYCHFTSPIRRYVDLVVHRILFGESDDFTYLQGVAAHCSDQERMSAKAESSVVMLKKMRLLDSMRQADPHREYQAVITKVKPFGIYFEILDLLMEGFIHVSNLDEDYFIYEEGLMRLRGRHKGDLFAPGNRIGVMLSRVDLVLQEARWYLSSKRFVEESMATKLPEIDKSAAPKVNKMKSFPNKKKALSSSSQKKAPRQSAQRTPLNKKGLLKAAPRKKKIPKEAGAKKAAKKKK